MYSTRRSDLISPTIVSPVFKAMRTSTGKLCCATRSRFQAAISSRSFSAAAAARAGWSGWSIGAPKNAITASPTNLSIVPSCEKIASDASVKKRFNIRASSGASIFSDQDVKPTRSAKRIVTVSVRTSLNEPVALTSAMISSTTCGE